MPKSDCANDNDCLVTGTPTTINVQVFESHLDRDIANFSNESCYPLRLTDCNGTTINSGYWNCHGATHHAFDGDGGPNSDKSWLEDTSKFFLVFSYPTTISVYSSAQKHDIIAFTDSTGNVQHSGTVTQIVETGSGSQTETFQGNYPVPYGSVTVSRFVIRTISKTFAQRTTLKKYYVYRRKINN